MAGKKKMFEETDRGFYIYARITDTRGNEIRVQQSSALGMDKLYLFVTDPNGDDVLHLVPGEGWLPLPRDAGQEYAVVSPHLDVQQCKELIAALQAHIDTVDREGLGEENVDENGWIKRRKDH